MTFARTLGFGSLLICPLLGGCISTFSETHYLASNARNADGTPVNYYRLNVYGGTALSSSRYISGYFDNTAIDQYFNEITQPTDATLIPASSNAPAGGAQAGGAATQPAPPSKSDYGASPIGQPPSNKSLMLILSANSDAIASGIGAYVTTNTMTANLSALLAPRPSQAGTGQLRQAQAQYLNAEIGQLLAQLPNPPTQSATQTTMLEIANRLAAYLGHTQPFKSLDEANPWVLAQGNASLGKE